MTTPIINCECIDLKTSNLLNTELSKTVEKYKKIAVILEKKKLENKSVIEYYDNTAKDLQDILDNFKNIPICQ